MRFPGLKKSDTVAFLKVRQIARTRHGISVSACDRKSLAPLVAELQRRFWPGETDDASPGY